MKRDSARKLALVMVLFPGGIVAGCDAEGEAPPTATTHLVETQETKHTPTHGGLPAVPPELVGEWQLSGQECELDSGEIPDLDPAGARLLIDPDFTYVMTGKGEPVAGTFTVNRFKDGNLRLQMADSLLNFDFDDGQLENWSEGDAPYLCGNIFVRIKDEVPPA